MVVKQEVITKINEKILSLILSQGKPKKLWITLEPNLNITYVGRLAQLLLVTLIKIFTFCAYSNLFKIIIKNDIEKPIKF